MTNEKMVQAQKMEREARLQEIRRQEAERYELELERLVSYQESLQEVKNDILGGLV